MTLDYVEPFNLFVLIIACLLVPPVFFGGGLLGGSWFGNEDRQSARREALAFAAGSTLMLMIQLIDTNGPLLINIVIVLGFGASLGLTGRWGVRRSGHQTPPGSGVSNAPEPSISRPKD